MKLLSVLLSVAGISGLVWVCPVAAETSLDTDKKEIVRAEEAGEAGGAEEAGREMPLQLGNASDLVAQGVTRVTGVEVLQTESGLELILETATGSERLVPLILPEGNDLVIDILDATLAFSIRNGVTETNPAPGINGITVNKADENSIRVRITGANQTPSAEVLPGRDDLVLSVTPQDTTAESEPDEEIEVIATGQADDEDSYLAPDASSTLKTDVELRDTPASVQVIPRQVIEDQGATTTRDVLRNASGVNFAQSGGNRIDTFIIRGFDSDGNTFRNGFRDGLFATRSSTELANIERVEILKGPASILFGRSEPSGIINFVTKQPLREASYEVTLTAGSFDFYRPTIDFTGPLTENGKLAYRLNASYESANSFRDGVETDVFFIAPTLDWEISDNTSLSLEFSYLKNTQPIDRGLVVLSDDEVPDIPLSTFLGNPDIRTDIEETRTELYFNHRFNDNLSLRTLLRYATATEENGGSTSNITGESEDDRFFSVVETALIPQTYETFIIQNDLTAKFNTGSLEHTLLFGVEYFTGINTGSPEERFGTIDIFNASAYESPDTPFELVADIEFTNESFSVFLQDQIAILDNLQLVIGGRFDTVDSEFDFDGDITDVSNNAFTPRVGIVYQPIEPVSLYASFSQSFSPSRFSVSADGEAFDPEEGTAFEVGVKGEIIKDKLISSLALFDITQTNVVTEDPDDPNFSVATGEQNSQGIELDIQGEILPGWNIIAGYAYIDAKVTEDNTDIVGNRLFNAPENNFNLWTTYTLQKGSLEGLGFGAGIFSVGERAGDLDNSFFVDGFTRVDAAISYERENYRAAVNFRNIFNIDYIEGADDRQEVYPGAPFEVLGTVSVKF